MLKNNFIAAQNAREPLEIIQDIDAEKAPDPGAQGNAFAGSRTNHDDEMHHAVRGAIMHGDTGGNSSIANAGMRLAAKFGSAATKSDKDAEKSRAMYMQVMNQQLQKMRDDLEATLNAMREKYGEMDEQLDSLARLRELVNDGNFDPTNPEHLALYNEAFNNDPEMSAEEFALETQSEQNDIIDGTESDVQAKQAELQSDIDKIEKKFDQVSDVDLNSEDPEKISELKAMVDQDVAYIEEKYRLEESNAEEIEPSNQSTIANNFSF